MVMRRRRVDSVHFDCGNWRYHDHRFDDSFGETAAQAQGGGYGGEQTDHAHY